MAHFAEQSHMVLDEDPARGVERDGIEQTHDKDLDGDPSSVERFVNFSEVVSHVGSVVEQARADHAIGDAPVS